MAQERRSRKIFMSTTNRTHASMSFRQTRNGNPCAFAPIDAVGIKVRPAVDPLAPGDART
jgi:hypothetical protein